MIDDYQALVDSLLSLTFSNEGETTLKVCIDQQSAPIETPPSKAMFKTEDFKRQY